MATVYSLSIKKLQVQPQLDGQQDVVIRVLWGYSGTAGAREAMIAGSTDITYVPGPGFTPYDQLTVDQVTDWVLSAWSTGERDSYRAMVDAQLTTLNPPWAQ